MNRRKAQITAADANTLAALQIVEEGNNQRRVDLLEIQARWRLMQSSFSEF
jgi:hypothetical protein